MVEPKCPSCDVRGLKYIVSGESDSKSKVGDAWFEIAYCSECGHVYGIFAKVVNPPSVRMPRIS